MLSGSLRCSLLLLILGTLLFGCDPAPASSANLDPAAVEDQSHTASIIRMPVSAEENGADTTDQARITFAEPEFLFGEVKEGKVIEHEFPFTNSGTQPLLISDARTTCGCTVSEHPTEPIEPGETGVIRVSFDTKNKYGRQRKPITIIANTYPSMTTVYMDGTIIND
ncbi:DUF1573 domain-containing protein [Lewinella sp. W8]|uniref:DUF1573 domain-containing protein n=1 Tax=Lewinella sp. W8 TaxID=2528208 RepID=UPI001067B614|nr:DUF1573 domain-containing protein [Lewinella sp. W8]MTB52132.1 DUF1573 domain-containing protein [Lewinella sp. W8]